MQVCACSYVAGAHGYVGIHALNVHAYGGQSVFAQTIFLRQVLSLAWISHRKNMYISCAHMHTHVHVHARTHTLAKENIFWLDP